MRLLLLAVRAVGHFVKKINEDDVAAYSGQSALFIIISFFPFVMFLLTLIQFLPFHEADLYGFIDPAFPEVIQSLVETVITEIYHNSTGTVISLTILSALWSASRGVLTIIHGLNSVYHIHETRNYFHLRLIATLYTLVLAIILILTLILLVFGNTIYVWFLHQFPESMQFLFMIINVRTIFTLILLILFFWALYAIVPNRKTRPLSELPGAIVAATGWMLFSFAYSFYIENFSNFSYMYGSLAAIVLLMLWLYFCMYILFIGGEINIVLQQIVPQFRYKKKP